MKILITCQSSAIGGVEKRLEVEAEVLMDNGWETVVAVPKFENQDRWISKLRNLGAGFISWNPYKFIERQHPGGFWRFLSRLKRRKISGFNFDLAHVSLPWTTVGMTRVFELKEAGVPVVLVLHCTYPKVDFPEKVLAQIKNALQGVVAAYAVSHSARQSFLDNFGEHCSSFPIDVIYNGIDCAKFARNDEDREAVRKRLKVSESEFLILFCGRMNWMKRPRFALKIMCHASIRKSAIKMVFVGDGEELEGMISFAADSGISDRVIFAGFIENPNEFFSAADAYISTSENSEGFNLAAGEALASGLPLFLPDYPVYQECFGECEAVRFLDGSDPEGWAEKILDVSTMSKKTLESFSISAENFCRSNIDISIMKRKISDFYTQIPLGNSINITDYSKW